jgi:uncharacterized membrane protein
MATTIESGISIDAPIDQVYEIAMDAESFPTFMPDVESVTTIERQEITGGSVRTVTKWVGLVPEFKQKVRWTEEDLWNRSAHTCDFKQISGDYQVYEGRWLFTSESDGATHFHSTLTYDLEIPLIGPLLKRIVAKKMQDNIDKILRAIKDRSEQK